MTSILVIGGGIAGQAVVEELRRRDAQVPLTLVCGEQAAPYDRVRLSHLLAGEADASELQLRPDAWYDDRGVELLLGTTVTALDPDHGTATLDDGRVIAFEQAAITTGSDALMPPLPGLDLPGVHAFRDPADCAAITSAAAAGVKRAAVIGGGLLGLEAAYGLVQRGVEVTVVHLVDRLMERQLDAAAGALLLPAIEALGVEVLLEHATAELLPGDDGRVAGMRFASGAELPADLVVVSIGIRSRTDLARAAGLDVNRGVVVDDRLRTSHPRVVSVGECAEHRGIVHGIVAPIHEQAAVAADTLLGLTGPAYEGSVPTAKLKVMGIDLVTAGAATGPREVINADGDSYRKVIVDADGRAIGAVLVGDTRGHELLTDVVKRAKEVEDPLALLVEASAATAEDLPDDAQVCNCNGVCKGEILDAVRVDGCASSREVMARTRAGTGCGSCKELVLDLVALATGGADEEPAYLCPCAKQTREQLVAAVRDGELSSVSELTAACGAGRDCGACKPGLAYVVSEVAASRHREERHARFINDRVHANIQKDGTFSVIPRIRGGVTTPQELRRIADVAERHEVPMVKITGGQRIDLLGIRKEALPRIWEELGMPSGHAYAKSVRTVKTCVGTDFCRFGLGDAIATGIELERRMEGLYTPHKVKAAVSGCPRNCAESYVKDIGVVAIEGGWEIYVGGAAGSSVRRGDLLATVATREDAVAVSLTFLQYYREHGEHLERTHRFVERVGLETIQAAVLDEQSGEPERLRERFAIAKAASDPDPWLERHDPVNPKQFAELDTEPEPFTVIPPAKTPEPVR
ncbi:MAG TPA: nitrite reductase large subunit NirB [Conexibacter sp.]|nr:nitrite reductase large subunit NirB [Conexibacter sp.]